MVTETQLAVVNLLSPANIISTDIVATTTNCNKPCDINISVTWQNIGDITGQFIPGIIVDNISRTLPLESLDGNKTVTHTFPIYNLVEGIHTIQSSPGPAQQYIFVTNIISTSLTIDKNDCISPCTINGSASWKNVGSYAGTINLAILVDNIPINIDTLVTINPGETKNYTFSLPNLTTGTYNVCASPDSGTNCQTIIVRSPNIIATTIVPNKTACIEPCDLLVDITWSNLGDADGEFVPSIRVDDVPIIPAQFPSESLAPGKNITHTFSIKGLATGSHLICPDPDTGETCTIITVKKLIQEGFGNTGMLLVAGLTLGVMLIGSKIKKKEKQ